MTEIIKPQKCISVQTIKIETSPFGPKITIDGKILAKSDHNRLAFNSGFTNRSGLYNFFSELPFEGKIIHWTDLKYNE